MTQSGDFPEAGNGGQRAPPPTLCTDGLKSFSEGIEVVTNLKLRSKGLSPEEPQYYVRRALMKSMGYSDQDLEKPLVVITWLIVDMGLDTSVALVIGGRFSGTSDGPCIGHVTPEAMRGGPIALIEDGDMINIDIPSRRLDVEVSDEELARRKKGWKPPKPKVPHGWLAHFAKHATSADKGAYLE